MGAEPWYYFVPFQPDINRALLELKQREFEAGRYNPALPFLEFPPGPGSAGPGAQHASIEEAIEAAGADGTRSILDMNRVATQLEHPNFGVVSPLTEEFLLEEFGTTQPTREMIEDGPDVVGEADRGEGIYTIIYKDGKPTEIFFAGLSYD
jgi:hypothetical protein